MQANAVWPDAANMCNVPQQMHIAQVRSTRRTHSHSPKKPRAHALRAVRASNMPCALLHIWKFTWTFENKHCVMCTIGMHMNDERNVFRLMRIAHVSERIRCFTAAYKCLRNARLRSYTETPRNSSQSLCVFVCMPLCGQPIDKYALRTSYIPIYKYSWCRKL